jgi:hypothetical protein
MAEPGTGHILETLAIVSCITDDALVPTGIHARISGHRLETGFEERETE